METQIINATEYRNVSLSLLSESKTKLPQGMNVPGCALPYGHSLQFFAALGAPTNPLLLAAVRKYVPPVLKTAAQT
jgi:hypothetical protein